MGPDISLFSNGERQVFDEVLGQAIDGYDHPDKIFEGLEEGRLGWCNFIGEDGCDLPSTRKYEIARLAIEWKRRDESAWPSTTDIDLLQAAFQVLERRNVICRENFQCCSNCARSEMSLEIAVAQQNAPMPRGYVWFDEQDLRAASVWGAPLTLVCGPVNWDAPDANGFGAEVRQVLEEAGLQVKESIVSETPVKILDVHMVWRKRMPVE